MKKILILASNPKGDLRLDREIRDLKKAVERSKNREQFDVEIELAVSPENLQELFHEYQPCIVHFCGHGTGEKGLVFEDRSGGEQIVSNQALSSLFRIFRDDVNCVLLNACHTEIQADAIVEHIQYVIGTSREILDKAAYWFAVGFYRGLGYGNSIEQCYELGCNAIELQMPNVTILPHISERYRKFEVVERNESVSVSESLKIVLKKNSLLFSRPKKTNIDIPPNFLEAINEEGNRKRYYDNLRDILERFGQTTIEQEKPLSQFEYRQRQTFLNKVHDFWIEGFLKPSLYFNTATDKDLDNSSSQILRPLDNLEVISIDIDKSYDELQQTDIIGQIGEGKTLLILGEPGSGKTIALLQLAERLIKLTQQDMTKPIPVVFNLSSWGQKQQPLEEWLIEELKDKYQVPKTQSKPWIKEQQLILLLDGLDEVKAEHRNACVRAINKFIATHLETEIVVCSRVKDYEALTERLLLSSAICIQPLSKKQLLEFLENADDSLLGLKTAIERDREIAEFAQTPLILNMMTWTYHGLVVQKSQWSLNQRKP
jgi:energy-coupling factor transporter ATP-binding protein EcfA2